jgi:hypothetical protein
MAVPSIPPGPALPARCFRDERLSSRWKIVDDIAKPGEKLSRAASSRNGRGRTEDDLPAATRAPSKKPAAPIRQCLCTSGPRTAAGSPCVAGHLPPAGRNPPRP